MPSVYRQKNNIVPAIRGCAKSAAPDVLYAARIDVYYLYCYLGDFCYMYIFQSTSAVQNCTAEVKEDMSLDRNVIFLRSPVVNSVPD